jgi:hypothetical protein
MLVVHTTGSRKQKQPDKPAAILPKLSWKGCIQGQNVEVQ